MVKSFSHNIRFYILFFSFVLSLFFLFFVQQNYTGTIQTIRLSQFYGLTALTFLYLTMLEAPLTKFFPNLPFIKEYQHSRRALGVGALYFSLLHGCNAFFFQLDGFAGLPFLSNNYLLSIGMSSMALTILFLLAITSFDRMINRMGIKRWEILQKFIYLASLLILIHALMLGTHFSDLSKAIPQIFLFAFAFLATLEAIRLDEFLIKKMPQLPRLGITMLTTLLVFFYLFLTTTSSPTDNVIYNIHAEHIRLAKEAQLQTANNTTNDFSNIPGLTGDKTKRYTVSFSHPEIINTNEEVELQFKVFDASSGEEVELFNKLYEKIVHMIVVDNTLTYFNHIHPEQSGSNFTINTSFPSDGKYHIYLDFQPFGAIEQQMAFTLDVGNTENITSSNQKGEQDLTKAFGTYEVTLDFPSPLRAEKMSIGQQELSFTIKDSTTKDPITTLKPYLAAFGHLVMINQKTFDYVHVHPSALRPPLPNENGGPTVKFLPLGIYGPIKPGVYRVFAQFNPDNNLFTSDFTIEIK